MQSNETGRHEPEIVKLYFTKESRRSLQMTNDTRSELWIATIGPVYIIGGKHIAYSTHENTKYEYGEGIGRSFRYHYITTVTIGEERKKEE